MSPLSSTSLLIHINYFEQGQTLEYACWRAAEAGADGIEFRRLSRDGQCQEEYLDRIAAAVDRFGVKKVGFGLPGPELMKEDKEERYREIAAYQRFLEEAAARLPLGVMNTTTGYLLDASPAVDPADVTLQGSGIAREEHWLWAIEGLKEIAGTCERLGVKLALETHPGYLHDLPEAALRLIKAVNSPQVGINLDLGNFAYFPRVEPMTEILELVKDHLFLLHLKNFTSTAGNVRIVGLREGEINHRMLFGWLKKAAYGGEITLEAPREGDREEYLSEDFAYCHRLLYK